MKSDGRPGNAVAATVLGSFLFFVAAPGVVAGFAPYALSAWRFDPPFLGLAMGRVAGVLLVLTGVVCLVECFARFAVIGLGTPAPVAPTETLVISGLYRHVRNPMYVAVVMIIQGQAILFANARLLWYGASIFVAFHLFVLLYEEPTLRKRHGRSYEQYQAAVRRWWPRLVPWPGAGPS